MTLKDTFNEGGGDIHSPRFIYNPQFNLTIEEETHIQIKCEVDNKIEVPINIFLVDSGEDIRYANFQNVFDNKNCGCYFNNFAYLEAILEAGFYTIVIATQNQMDVILLFLINRNR